MIIKSMSRKHPSFDQLIDYIEAGAKNRNFEVFHNTYTRDIDQLKTEFNENAKHLKFRKNGVYLYHEIFSITRSERLDETAQKTILQRIVTEYIRMRAGKNLAYAILHEDKKDNLHFHIVISSNELHNSTRHRLSKEDFAEIQTQLERMVLQTFPELEQKAVFEKNQTQREKEQKQRNARISNQGAELNRRARSTPKREDMKTTIEKIFTEATDGRHFTELLKQADLQLYQRGKNYGITDKDGIKYRFATLGLAEAWDALDKRMMERLNRHKAQQDTQNRTRADTLELNIKSRQDTAQDRLQDTKDTHRRHEETAKTHQKAEASQHSEPHINEPQKYQSTATTKTEIDPVEAETQRRIREMEEIRQARADRENATKQQDKQR